MHLATVTSTDPPPRPKLTFADLKEGEFFMPKHLDRLCVKTKVLGNNIKGEPAVCLSGGTDYQVIMSSWLPTSEVRRVSVDITVGIL